MKFVIVLVVVIAYVFHEGISQNYGHGGPYGGGGPGGDYDHNMGGSPYDGGEPDFSSGEPNNYNEPHGNNYVCPFTCERAKSVEFTQSQAIPLGLFFNKAKSDHALQASYSTKSEDGYTFEKFLGGVFAMAQTDTCAIYYLFNDGISNSFYSSNDDTDNVPSSNGNYVVNGIKFYCYCIPYFYTIPLYEFFCADKNDTAITTDFDSVTSSACTYIRTICWILPPLPSGSPSNGGYSSGGGGYQSGGGGGYQSGGGGGYQSGGGGYHSGGGGYSNNNYGGHGGY